MSIEKSNETTSLGREVSLPLLIDTAANTTDCYDWAMVNHGWAETQLLNHGGLLMRNFGVTSAVEFERFITFFSGELLDYTNGSTPRSRVGGNIFTSTEYPASELIPLHNELSYSEEWPMKLWFLCLRAASKGGETPIADSRAVFNHIDRKIRERFMRKKVMYTRNYGLGVDLSWQNAFQTTSQSDVEAYCRSAGIEYKWIDEVHLRTRQVCQATSRHPKSGEMVWFNQAHLFHPSNLKPETREALLSLFKEEDLPRNAYYGDGTPIEAAVLDEIREIYQQETVLFAWRNGDILMLDNMLTAHGRMPFMGPRHVLVGMAERFSARTSVEQKQ